MKQKDNSKEIFEKYFNAQNRILEITLKDNTVIEGALISFVHGDEPSGEPFITRWHFLDKDEVNKQNSLISLDWGGDHGKIIMQKDIKNVKFKD